MFEKVSVAITKVLEDKKIIQSSTKEVCAYGLRQIFSTILNAGTMLLIGFLMQMLIEAILFTVIYIPVRVYAGGYHAATETRCEILSTLSILACIAVIRLSKIYDIQTVLLIIGALSAVCIFVFCPLDTPEKPLSDKEFKYFRKVSLIILLVIVVAIVVSYVFKFQFMTVPCCLSLILESILLVAGKIKRVSQKNNVKT